MVEVVVGPKTYPLNGRTASLVLYLIKRMELINGHSKLKIEFNCLGRDLRPKFEIFEDSIQSEK